MELGTSVLSTGTPSTLARNPRARPMHTCGVSILSIARKAYIKAESLHGPIGSLAQTIATFAGPIVYTMQHKCLAILSFTDDQILAVENIVETIFPPSTYVFDKIDTLVHISETLPGKFDNAVDRFQVIIRREPFLYWATTQLTSWLSFLVSILTDWEFCREEEKEIIMDSNCDNLANELISEEKPEGSTQPANVENENKLITKQKSIEKSTGAMMDKSGVQGGDGVRQVKSTYKEVLEMKKEENTYKSEVEEIGKKEHYTYKEVLQMGNKPDSKKEEGGEEAQKPIVYKGTFESGHDEVVKEDPFIELFAAGWHMK